VRKEEKVEDGKREREMERAVDSGIVNIWFSVCCQRLLSHVCVCVCECVKMENILGNV
jgi:putative lipase involved disintegration of autophagic bodies